MICKFEERVISARGKLTLRKQVPKFTALKPNCASQLVKVRTSKLIRPSAKKKKKPQQII